jgi:hypothetical protein
MESDEKRRVGVGLLSFSLWVLKKKKKKKGTVGVDG